MISKPFDLVLGGIFIIYGIALVSSNVDVLLGIFLIIIGGVFIGMEVYTLYSNKKSEEEQKERYWQLEQDFRLVWEELQEMSKNFKPTDILINKDIDKRISNMYSILFDENWVVGNIEGWELKNLPKDLHQYEKRVKRRLLMDIHGYTIEEADVLVKQKEKVEKEAKLREEKRKINEEMRKRYGKIPEDDKRQPIPDDVKMYVWQRDEGKCVKCGSRKNLEFDHIIPVSKGGSNTARNIQLLCEECNREKRDKIS